MEKERLTLEDVSADIYGIIRDRRRAYFSWRLKFIVPSVLLLYSTYLAATGFGLAVGHYILYGIGIAVASYNLVMLFVQLFGLRKVKRALYRGLNREDVSVSIEKFSHIAHEDIYEPWFSGRYVGCYKRVRLYYFSSGAGWREPVCYSHYAWSSKYETSSKGLENTSIAGDEFYLITLNVDREFKYVYNTKLFDFVE